MIIQKNIAIFLILLVFSVFSLPQDSFVQLPEHVQLVIQNYKHSLFKYHSPHHFDGLDPDSPKILAAFTKFEQEIFYPTVYPVLLQRYSDSPEYFEHAKTKLGKSADSNSVDSRAADHEVVNEVQPLMKERDWVFTKQISNYKRDPADDNLDSCGIYAFEDKYFGSCMSFRDVYESPVNGFVQSDGSADILLALFDPVSGKYVNELHIGTSSTEYAYRWVHQDENGNIFVPLYTHGTLPKLSEPDPGYASYMGAISRWDAVEERSIYNTPVFCDDDQNYRLRAVDCFQGNCYATGDVLGTVNGVAPNSGTQQVAVSKFNNQGKFQYSWAKGSPEDDWPQNIQVGRSISAPRGPLSKLTSSQLSSYTGDTLIYIGGETTGQIPGATPASSSNATYFGFIICLRDTGSALVEEWILNLGMGSDTEEIYSMVRDPWNRLHVGVQSRSGTFNGVDISAQRYGGADIVITHIDPDMSYTFDVFGSTSSDYPRGACLDFANDNLVISGSGYGVFEGLDVFPPVDLVPWFLSFNLETGAYDVSNSWIMEQPKMIGFVDADSIVCGKQQGIVIGSDASYPLPGADMDKARVGISGMFDSYVMRFGGTLEYQPKPDPGFDWELFLAIFLPLLALASIAGGVYYRKRKQNQNSVDVSREHTSSRERMAKPNVYSTFEKGQTPSRISVIEDSGGVEMMPLFKGSHQGTGTLRLLSLDGGGMRGLALITMLQCLHKTAFSTDKETPTNRIYHLFDFVAGSSTGGILALGIFGKQLTLSSVSQLYLNLGHQVFKKSKMAKIKQLAGKGLYGSSLIDFLQSSFGFEPLSPTDKPVVHLFAVSANASHDPPSCFLLKNYSSSNQGSGASYDGSQHFLLFQAAAATSAAPTFFDTFSCVNQRGVDYSFADGSIITNNPARILTYEAKRVFPHHEIVAILSLGTGNVETLDSNGTQAGERSVLGWAKTMAKLVTSSQQVHEDMTRDFTENSIYFRFSPTFRQLADNREFLMDDCRESTIQRIVSDTWEYMNTVNTLISKAAKILVHFMDAKSIQRRIREADAIGMSVPSTASAIPISSSIPAVILSPPVKNTRFPPSKPSPINRPFPHPTQNARFNPSSSTLPPKQPKPLIRSNSNSNPKPKPKPIPSTLRSPQSKPFNSKPKPKAGSKTVKRNPGRGGKVGASPSSKPKPKPKATRGLQKDPVRSASSPTIPRSTLKVGQKIRAKWSGDGSFYSATILEIRRNQLKVSFDAYGNTEVVRKTDIKF